MRLFPWISFSLALCLISPARGGSPTPWMNRALPLEKRVRLLVAAMTLDEKIALVHSGFGTAFQGRPRPDGALNSAGFAPGIPRLSIPPLLETDAGLGVANPASLPIDATALPSGLALGATFDPALARASGAVIGGEAHARGFNMMLAGGANLTRDPRNGRNFEYIGEDPLLTGVMVGEMVAGIQSRGIMSTVKHYAVNAQETGRVMLSSKIAEDAARESDLLAFQIALERGAPASVMTGYNQINGVYASENSFLIRDVLKGDWGYRGWVMSDWGGTHSTETAALAGLDQESGENLDPGPLFGPPLKAAILDGRVPVSRLDDMVTRILRAELRAGVIDHPPKAGLPFSDATSASVAEDVARQGIVLLKNRDGLLPLARALKRILILGEHVDFGVLSGGGSSQVVPIGALRLPGDPPGRFFGKPKLYEPCSPLEAIKHQAPDAIVTFLDGQDIAAATDAARKADIVVLFAEQWMNEGRDAPSLSLPRNQDALIAAVATANPKTIVVLQTGGPVTMPWLDAVPAVLEVWYSGSRGAPAIASVLFGTKDPAGRLPITFPEGEAQLPRLAIRNPDSVTANPGETLKGPIFAVDYDIEGANVGYKWFEKQGHRPLFPFGFGLSYTRFGYSRIETTTTHGTIEVGFSVTNLGTREGIDTPQVYLDSLEGRFARRLVGWRRVALRPGETRHVSVTVDPRLMATFDTKRHGWRVAAGRYAVSVRSDALADGPRRNLTLAARHLPP